MAKSKHGKYITTELKQGVVMPGFKGDQKIGQGYRDGYRMGLEHVIWMDEEVIPGAFYAECTWQWPPTMKDQRPRPSVITPEMAKNMPGITPHSHPFIELFCYFGTNMDDPGDLGGEIEFWLEDEKFILTRSFQIYIPANMMHCPLRILRMDRPMYHLTVGSGHKYV
ncbi:MAG: hypothetical protein A2Z29_11520 [Chloroflexi bacterium RBG_16_56_11]|nr:MAG: hypothetical protein A2Z29_11520 [Chloroflexi bacterium RBG_16_56_11]